jgi:hypothetical protein
LTAPYKWCLCRMDQLCWELAVHRGRGVSISVDVMRVLIRPTHHHSLAENHESRERGGFCRAKGIDGGKVE